MRLLNVDTLELEEYFGDHVPYYAILSHTWQQGEEISFVELATPEKAQNKAGWKKIHYTCKQAKQHGLQFVWVDTCCIDKRSSAELSEAINSMFAWYTKAEICYVYMSDVSKRDFDTTFPASRWFTRGWTLQELLAPSNVIFYDKEWKELGQKASGSNMVPIRIMIFCDNEWKEAEETLFRQNDLASLISNITKIDKIVLENPDYIQQQSVACKMSWVSSRTTTRLEDVAYSLMGIFGVNMPLLYGEGNRAFGRLQEEILKSGVDHSLFAWNLKPFNLEILSEISTRDSPFVPVPLFADSPQGFRNSGNIVRGKNSNSRKDPCTMTNAGLQLTLPIAKTAKGPLGLLDCHVKWREDYLVAIPLFQFEDKSHYMRRQVPGSWGSKIVRFEDVVHARTEDVLLLTDYEDNRYFDPYPNLTHHEIIIVQTEAAKSILTVPTSVLPPERSWNLESQTLQLPWPGSRWPSVVLKFGYHVGIDKLFIILERNDLSSLVIRLVEVVTSLEPLVLDEWDGSAEQWIRWADSHSIHRDAVSVSTILPKKEWSSLLLSRKPGRWKLRVTFDERKIYRHSIQELVFDIVNEDDEMALKSSGLEDTNCSGSSLECDMESPPQVKKKK